MVAEGMEGQLMDAAKNNDFYKLVVVLNAIRDIPYIEISSLTCEAVFLNIVLADKKYIEKSIGAMNVFMDVLGHQISFDTLRRAYRFYQNCNCRLGMYILANFYDDQNVEFVQDISSLSNIEVITFQSASALNF